MTAAGREYALRHLPQSSHSLAYYVSLPFAFSSIFSIRWLDASIAASASSIAASALAAGWFIWSVMASRTSSPARPSSISAFKSTCSTQGVVVMKSCICFAPSLLSFPSSTRAKSESSPTSGIDISVSARGGLGIGMNQVWLNVPLGPTQPTLRLATSTAATSAIPVNKLSHSNRQLWPMSYRRSSGRFQTSPALQTSGLEQT